MVMGDLQLIPPSGETSENGNKVSHLFQIVLRTP